MTKSSIAKLLNLKSNVNVGKNVIPKSRYAKYCIRTTYKVDVIMMRIPITLDYLNQILH